MFRREVVGAHHGEQSVRTPEPLVVAQCPQLLQRDERELSAAARRWASHAVANGGCVFT